MSKLMVWITVNAKKGMRDNLIKILDEPFGHAFTVKQKGCERLERSIDQQNPNCLLLTELWTSRDDWDTYFDLGQKVRDQNGFNKRLGEQLEQDGIQIVFSDLDEVPFPD